MNFGLRLLICSILLIAISSIALAEEITFGEFTVHGDLIYIAEGGDLRIESLDNILIQNIEANYDFIFSNIKASIDEEGILTGLVEEDTTIIQTDYNREKTSEWDLTKGTSFTLDLSGRTLEITEGNILFINGVEFLTYGKPVLLVEDAIIAEEMISIPGLGEAAGVIEVQNGEIYISPWGIDPGFFRTEEEDIEIIAGRVLINPNTEDFRSTSDSYFLRDENAMSLVTGDGTIVDYVVKEGNTIFSSDSSQSLELSVSPNSFITAESRADENKIPLVDTDGYVEVHNGKSKLFKSDKITVSPPTYPELSIESELLTSLEETSRSIPLIVNFEDGSTITYSGINTYNYYSGGRLVTESNPYEIPITEDFETSQLTTLEGLREKWPAHAFYTSSSSDSQYLPSAESIQSLNFWLEENPNNKVETFFFSSESGDDFQSGKTITLSDTLYFHGDQTEQVIRPDRDFFSSPLVTTDHEYSHFLVEAADEGTEPGEEGSLTFHYNNIALNARDGIIADPKFQSLQFELIDNVEDFPVDIDDPYGMFEWCLQSADGLDITVSCIRDLATLSQQYGLPATYALRNYGDARSPLFYEVPSTFIEEPLDVRIKRANSQNEILRENYRKMAQLAYDSDQISANDCEAILGERCTKGVYWSREADFHGFIE